MTPILSAVTKLALPTLDDPAQLKGLVVNALDLLGEDLGVHIDSQLIPLLGKEWLADLAYDRKIKGFYSLQDPGFILKEILFYSTSPMRRALPGGARFYKRLEQAQNYRNLYFHNEGRRDLDSVAVVIHLLAQIAAEVPLPNCLPDLNAAIDRLNGLKRGETYEISQVHLDQIAELERKVAQYEEDNRIEREKARKSEREVESAQEALSKKEDELIRLKRLDDTRSTAYQKAEKDRSIAEEYVIRMHSQYLQQLAIVEQKSQEEKRLQQLLKSASDSKVRKKPVSKKAAKKNIKKGLAKKNLGKVAKKPAKKKVAKKSGTRASLSRVAMTPGSVWTASKGTRRLTLSANFKTVYDTKTGEISESLKPVARALAKEWLEIKPQGGRVFLDSQGNATCYIGEDLIYLGDGLKLLG